jgi:pre-mRNA-splicing factor CWC22
LRAAEIGELLLHRVIAQFKRAYKRNDKPITIAAAKFLAHLINQGVLHEVRGGGLGGQLGGALVY